MHCNVKFKQHYVCFINRKYICCYEIFTSYLEPEAVKNLKQKLVLECEWFVCTQRTALLLPGRKPFPATAHNSFSPNFLPVLREITFTLVSLVSNARSLLPPYFTIIIKIIKIKNCVSPNIQQLFIMCLVSYLVIN